MENKNIECIVHDCINNCTEKSYCKLKKIKVGKIKNTNEKENTVCESYKKN